MSSQPKLISEIERVFQRGFAQSKLITLAQWRRLSWWRHRILGNLVNFFQWQL